MDRVLYIALLQTMTDDEFHKFMSFTSKEQEQAYCLWVGQRIDLIRRYRRAGNG